MKQLKEDARLTALDALRFVSLWITHVELDDNCAYMNGDDGRKDGGNALSDLEKIRPKVDAAIAALAAVSSCD
jgi:hypothetical protein